MSKKMKKVGLTLGKFAPFHKGHQLLVETALSETDVVYVLIYDCPETISIPLKVRADWIRQIYPSVKVIEGMDGPKESGKDPRIMKSQEDYIKKMIPETVTHFYSSEWYGRHVSKALGAIDRRVDQKRTIFPVSGTLVRSNPA